MRENKPLRLKALLELKTENENIRRGIDKLAMLLDTTHPLNAELWDLINKLVENEINQEELCN